uniref:Lipoprotein n=1 Tax=Streptomyces sp. NBC_00093 TaxID=2975649 RepID=A0AAU2A9P2_9ACTN
MSQQQTRRPFPRRAVALAALLTAVVLPLTTACTSDTSKTNKTDKADKKASESMTPAPVAAVVAPAKVEVIAQLTGCTVKIRTDADELREGVCHTALGDYLITTFPAEKYKLTWLDSAAMYGGKYLVGTKWVISAAPKLLEPLRQKVGGTIEDLSVQGGQGGSGQGGAASQGPTPESTAGQG